MRLLAAGFTLFLTLLGGCAGLGTTAAPAGAPAEPMASGSGPTQVDRSVYKLSAGDRVRIDVYGESDLNAEETLDVSGTINYPLLGRIQATGLTLKELEQAVVAKLKAGYLVNPSVRASIILFRPIYIIGQVRRAGSYPYIEGLTVEKAVALAGGLTEIASTRKMFVLRESSPQNQRERAVLQTPIFPGDTIVIEESLF